jgi:hypothetical protein
MWYGYAFAAIYIVLGTVLIATVLGTASSCQKMM